MTGNYINYAVGHNTKITDLSTLPPKTYTQNEFQQRIDAATHGLLKLNLPNGSYIGILSNNSADYMVIFAGIKLAGHVAVPLNHKLSAEQLRPCLSNVVLVFGDQINGISNIPFGSAFEKFLDYTKFELPVLDHDRPCQCIYTSGSTGIPKGVIVSFAATMYRIQHSPTTKNAVSLSPNPFYHIAGLNWFEWTMVKPDQHLIISSTFNATQFLKDIITYQPTELDMVPSMMSMLLKEIASVDLSFVINVRLRSSEVSEKLYHEIQQHFTHPELSIVNPYGLTEVSNIFKQHPKNIPRPIGSVGYPHCDVKLVDGVLQVKSPGLFQSYNNKDNVLTKDGYFITNDLFRVDDNGFYFYVGRADDMFKSGGEKIYPKDIETVLLTHSAVVEALVVGIEDDVKGYKPYAFVKISSTVTEQELIEYIANNMSTYQIPRRIYIVDKFPVNAIGKIDKSKLKSLVKEKL